jgi:hypothetical protein
MEPKILLNLWQVGGPVFTSSEDAAIYLIRFGDKAALIDAGCGNGHDLLKINISECIPEKVPIEYLSSPTAILTIQAEPKPSEKNTVVKLLPMLLMPFTWKRGIVK